MNVAETTLQQFFGLKKNSKTISKLEATGIISLEDLLRIVPLRIFPTPDLQPFADACENSVFKGTGKIIARKFMPAFGSKGKGRVQLFQASVVVQETQTDHTILLRWFNAYPNIISQLKETTDITFMGKVQIFQGNLQIANPKIEKESIIDKSKPDFLIEYPTINSIPGNTLKKLIDAIPNSMIQKIQSNSILQDQNQYMNLSEAFLVMHGRSASSEWTDDKLNQAKMAIAVDEISRDQLRIFARKLNLRKENCDSLSITPNSIEDHLRLLPFSLTDDQQVALHDIVKDLNSGHPMMRMIQGDVGCGKTAIALLTSSLVIDKSKQVAFMAPTETLAQQHFNSAKEFFKQSSVNVALLTGSLKSAEKKAIIKDLQSNKIQLIIGTHALFQKDIFFHELGLIIIDEQHKFGVTQRLRLSEKGTNPHCLIMTATPIPRTLRLTQYGDLDISTIKTMPLGRKGTKTKIITTDLYQKYLSFIKTRLSIGEQIYVVVPAIEESEKLAIKSVEQLYEFYQTHFKEYSIGILHGQLSTEEKNQAMESFKMKQTKILIATSVIEVGINVPSATVMSIYNPERFGLSSIHQLRGRVGRGELPGFCFLIPEANLSDDSLSRLKVVESTTDGFIIAEEDLKRRGQGDLFGAQQSGAVENPMFEVVDAPNLIEKIHNECLRLYQENPELLEPMLKTYQNDIIVNKTI